MRARKWILLGMWVLSLILISSYGGAISYGLFFAVSFLPIISFIYILCVYSSFRIYQEIQSRDVICRRPVSYYFVLQNEFFFGFASVKVRMFTTLSSIEELQDDMEYELLPGDRYTYETKMTCKYRGEYEVGIKEVTITDFFRLFQVKYHLMGTIKALVKPRTIQVQELTSISDIVSFVQRESQSADTELDVVVRDYVLGDPLKQIEWKATAREQKLKVRNRIGEEKQKISLLYETKRYRDEILDYLPPENQVLETVLALGWFLAEKRITYTIQRGTKENAFREVTGLGDYEELYQFVSETSFSLNDDTEDFFTKSLTQSAKNGNKIVLCVLQSLSMSVITSLQPFLDLGMTIVVYLVTDDNIEELSKLGNDRLRINVVPVHAKLEEIL